VRVLSTVDVLIITDVYAAGESPIAGADSSGIARSIRMISELNPVCVRGVEDVRRILDEVVLDDDLVITMGAGTIGSLPASLVTSSNTINSNQVSIE
jgi:UDP-N-acetylmuramate--alanine ligase